MKFRSPQAPCQLGFLAALAAFLVATSPAVAATLTVLHHFSGGRDGSQPAGAVTRADDGSLYGTTWFGGGTAGHGKGTVYRIDLLGSLSTMFVFPPAVDSNPRDGKQPLARLLEGADGSLYGTASTGGPENLGTIFKVTKDGEFTLLHSFSGGDGRYPETGLTLGSDANFYGGTSSGGSNSFGVIFQLTPSGAFAILHDFSGSDGAFVRGDLVEGADGNFYGTTEDLDPVGLGTIFRISPAGTFTTLHFFNGAEGSHPRAGLVWGADGNLYGTTSSGGEDGNGTVFQYRLDGALTVLHSFSGDDGALSQAPLLLGSDGNFYGTTENGGLAGLGTVFQLTPSNQFTSIHSFTGRDGSVPAAGLVEAQAGVLVGTTFAGGIYGAGTTFRFDLGPDPLLATSQLLNISTRAEVQAGDEVAIGGFIITGSAPKEVLIRGLGPSLGAAGLTNVLTNPSLTLINQSTGAVVKVNDDWHNSPQVAAIEASGVAPSNDLESAMIELLAPGAYTAILHDARNAPGIGLVEIYDVGATVMSQLANISTRALVGSGDNVLIGGVIVGGSGNRLPPNIVLRALGPSLAMVTGTLLDPTLELHDGNGVTIASNNDWKDSQQSEIEATGLAPTGDRESVIATAVAAGNYTAIVSGVGSNSGIALVEVYNLDATDPSAVLPQTDR